MDNKDRFGKIENESITVGITRKEKRESRFDRLEYSDDAGQPGPAPAADKKYFPCFRCNRNNRAGSLYCIYCGEIFPDVAESTGSGLEPYEIRCPQCGKTGNRNQKSCIWCGHGFVPTEENILARGTPVEIEINGIRYRSTDRYLPGFVREAMVKMKKGGLSPAGKEEILRELRAKQAGSRFEVLLSIEKGRNAAAAYSLLAAGGFITFGAMILADLKKPVAALIVGIPGFLIILAGMLMLAISGRENGQNPMG